MLLDVAFYQPKALAFEAFGTVYSHKCQSAFFPVTWTLSLKIDLFGGKQLWGFVGFFFFFFFFFFLSGLDGGVGERKGRPLCVERRKAVTGN